MEINNDKLLKLHSLMLDADRLSNLAQSKEQEIGKAEEEVFGDLKEAITDTLDWQDDIIGGYSNAEFNYLKFHDFKEKINVIINEIASEGDLNSKNYFSLHKE